MSTGGFQRVAPLGDGFIRGPARFLVCPYTYSYPVSISKVIAIAGTETQAAFEAKWENGEQEISKTEATKGTFQLGFASYPTAAIKFNAKGSEIVTALEAIPSIGTGGIECTNPTKTLVEEALKFKFAGELKNHAQPAIQVVNNLLEKAAPGDSPLTVKVLKVGFGEYDPIGEWSDIGSSKGGIKIMRNNTESIQDIDQIQAAITSLPDQWEMNVEAAITETTLENIQLAWEGGKITRDSTQTPNERHVGLGGPLHYEERRMAVIHKKNIGTSANKLRMHVFRRVLRSAVASSIDYQKTGNMASIAVNFRCFADTQVADLSYQFGEVIDQTFL